MKGSPAISSDGTAYFDGGSEGGLYAVSLDGNEKWSRPLSMNGSSPLVGPSNTVCAVGYGYLYSIRSDGSTNWFSLVGDSGLSTPVMANDGSIYVAGLERSRLYGFFGDGNVKWIIENLPSVAGDTIAIGRDGTLYLAWRKLYAFSANGTEIWENDTNSFAGGASPAVGTDGTIYVASNGDESLYAISPAGQKRWNVGYGTVGPPSFGYATTTPAIDASGLVYYAASNSIFAINSNGDIQWIFSSKYALLSPPPPPIPTAISPAIGAEGTIYAAFGSTLYAIQGSGNPMATSPWPMCRQNLRHTGKVEKPSLAPPKKRPDANFDIQLAGEIGQAYSVQSTSNFLNWDFLTNFVATTLSRTVSDLSATNASARFYRATTP